MPSRTEVRTVFCPRCHVEPKEKCIGVRNKPRESCHQERVDYYVATQR